MVEGGERLETHRREEILVGLRGLRGKKKGGARDQITCTWSHVLEVQLHYLIIISLLDSKSPASHLHQP